MWLSETLVEIGQNRPPQAGSERAGDDADLPMRVTAPIGD